METVKRSVVSGGGQNTGDFKGSENTLISSSYIYDGYMSLYTRPNP